MVRVRTETGGFASQERGGLTEPWGVLGPAIAALLQVNALTKLHVGSFYNACPHNTMPSAISLLLLINSKLIPGVLFPSRRIQVTFT